MNDEDIWQLQAIKDEITELKNQIKPLEVARSVLEEQIMEDMLKAGSSLFRTLKEQNAKRITVSVNTEEVASVNDWAEFEEYIYEHKALYLLQRRPSDPAYRDEIAAHGDLPGVETFTKVKLSLTNKVT